jgi:translocation and assembly module TamB
MRWLGVVITFALLAIPAMSYAQTSQPEPEKSLVVQYLEETLSAPGRNVRLNGVTGELSAQADIAEITVADRQGIWLRIQDARIDWTRSALLSGQLRVDALTAKRVEVMRKPVPEPTTLIPEAHGFTLPDLPIDIQIGRFNVEQLVLSEDLIGTSATLNLQGRTRLDATGLSLSLDAVRTDGSEGKAQISADYSRVSRRVNLGVFLDEPSNGLVVNTLNIENRPALRASINGKGDVSDLSVLLKVNAAGDDLINGQVHLTDIENGQAFSFSGEGQFASLVSDQYRGFFGDSTTLKGNGQRNSDGVLRLEDLQVLTKEFALSAQAETYPDGFPKNVALKAELSAADGKRVTLPFANAAYSVEGGQISATFGQASDESWSVLFDLTDFSGGGFNATVVSGSMRGTAQDLADPETRQLTAKTSFRATGLSASNPDVTTAVGNAVLADMTWSWQADQPFQIERAEVTGETVKVTGSGAATISGFTGRMIAEFNNLAVMSVVMPERPISGTAAVGFDGFVNPITGQIDGLFSVTGRNINTGVIRLDAAIAGDLSAKGHVRRDATGLAVEGVTMSSHAGTMALTGRLSSDDAELDTTISLVDLSWISPALTGSGKLFAKAAGPLDAIEGIVKISGSSGYELDASGIIGASSKLALRFSDLPLAMIKEFEPALDVSGQLSGTANVTGDIAQPDVSFAITGAGLTGPSLTQYGLGQANLSANGRWYEGELSLKQAEFFSANGVSLKGSGQIETTTGEINLEVSGRSSLLLANEILNNPDVTVAGTAELSLKASGLISNPSLNGFVDVASAAISLPGLGVRFQNISTRIDLAQQQAHLSSVVADVAGGGQVSVSGTLGYGPGMPVDLNVKILGMTYSEGDFMSAVLDGDVAIAGGLNSAVRVSGEIAPRSIEIALSSAPVEAASLADIQHRHANRDTQQTLQRAGLLNRQPSGSAHVDLGFDLTVRAPRQIFVRGRGLDAELGGTILLTGQYTQIEAAGRFDLLRGRLDFLGRRLDLTEGSLAFSGSFDPQINFVSKTRVDDYDLTLALTGSAEAPVLDLTSNPDLPQDEILAKLVFGRDLSSLSPFQVISLASAVAELSGRADSGLLERLRRSTGLDNLDIRTDATGNATGVLGKYLNEKTYSEVEIDSNGKTGVSINLDISDTLKAQGRVDSDGNAGLGLYFEKDY